MNKLLGEIEPNSMMVDSNNTIKQFNSLSEKIRIRMNSKKLKYIKLNRLDKDTNLDNVYITLQDILSTNFPQNKFKITYEHVFTPKMKDGIVIPYETISIIITWN